MGLCDEERVLKMGYAVNNIVNAVSMNHFLYPYVTELASEYYNKKPISDSAYWLLGGGLSTVEVYEYDDNPPIQECMKSFLQSISISNMWKPENRNSYDIKNFSKVEWFLSLIDSGEYVKLNDHVKPIFMIYNSCQMFVYAYNRYDDEFKLTWKSVFDKLSIIISKCLFFFDHHEEQLTKAYLCSAIAQIIMFGKVDKYDDVDEFGKAVASESTLKRLVVYKCEDLLGITKRISKNDVVPIKKRAEIASNLLKIKINNNILKYSGELETHIKMLNGKVDKLCARLDNKKEIEIPDSLIWKNNE